MRRSAERGWIGRDSEAVTFKPARSQGGPYVVRPTSCDTVALSTTSKSACPTVVGVGSRAPHPL